MRVTPLGVYLRVIVIEKPLNLEKTTSCFLSVLLLIYNIYSWCTCFENEKYLYTNTVQIYYVSLQIITEHYATFCRITKIILYKDDFVFVPLFPCLLEHPVSMIKGNLSEAEFKGLNLSRGSNMVGST